MSNWEFSDSVTSTTAVGLASDSNLSLVRINAVIGSGDACPKRGLLIFRLRPLGLVDYTRPETPHTA